MTRFFWSDLHLNHDREFIYAARGYQSVKEMNEALIRSINSTVQADDELYLLGDLCLGVDIFDNKTLLGRINCRNIHIILGNHDTNNRIKMYESLWNVVEIAYGGRINIGKYTFMLSHFPMNTTNYDDVKARWMRVHHLYGHTHSKDIFENARNGGLNVSVDASDHPLSENEIISLVKEIL